MFGYCSFHHRDITVYRLNPPTHPTPLYVQVMLMHGDSHNYRADQPFAASDWLQTLDAEVPALDNFMRAMGPGSPTTNWVKVCVDPSKEASTLFSHGVVAVKANHDDIYFS